MKGSWRIWIVLGLALALLPVALPLAANASTCTDLIVNGGFESDGAWLLGQTAVTPQYVTHNQHSGSRSLLLGIISGGNVKSYSSARQTVAIPAGATSATLSFWFFSQMTGAPTTDYAELALLEPGTDKVIEKLWRSTNDARVWNQMSFDVSRWRGRTVQVYFNVYNDGAGGVAALFLDDVALAACSGGPTPGPWTATPPPPTWIPTATPIPGWTPTPPSGCVESIQNSSFESGLTFWQGQGDLAGVVTVNTPVHTGNLAVRLGSLDTSLNGLSSVRQQIVVPVGYTKVTLEAWVYAQTQPGAGADFQEIAILNQFGSVIFVPWRVLQDNPAWQRLQFDITGFAGQSIFVRLGVNNDGAGGRTQMVVDDVRVTSCNAGAGTPTPVWWTPVPTSGPTVWWTPPPTVWITPPPATGCVDLLRNNGFEAGWPPWVLAPNQILPQLLTSPVVSGYYAAQMGSTSTNRNSYSSIRQQVQVPWDRPRVFLQFFAFTWATSLSGSDRQQAVILGPGDKVLAVPWSALTNERAWRFHNYQLPITAGQVVSVYFNAINDGAGGVTALNVDDAHLWACDWSSTPPPVAMPYASGGQPEAAAASAAASAQAAEPVAVAANTASGPAVVDVAQLTGGQVLDLPMGAADRSGEAEALAAAAVLRAPETQRTRVAIAAAPEASVVRVAAAQPGAVLEAGASGSAQAGSASRSNGSLGTGKTQSPMSTYVGRLPAGATTLCAGALLLMLGALAIYLLARSMRKTYNSELP